MEATAFLSRHPGLTGFSEQNALFMTVKELLDNAIDAVTTLKIEKNAQGMNPHLETRQAFKADVLPDVLLDLNKLDSTNDVDDGIKVICKDGGIGFKNDTFSFMVTAFRSGKRSSTTVEKASSQNTNTQNVHSQGASQNINRSQGSSQNTNSQSATTVTSQPNNAAASNSKKQSAMCGTFGIGLKMVLLHAQKVHRTDVPAMVVKSRLPSDGSGVMAAIFELGYITKRGESGEEVGTIGVTGMRKSTDAAPYATEVSAIVDGKVDRRIGQYVACVMLWRPYINFKLIDPRCITGPANALECLQELDCRRRVAKLFELDENNVVVGKSAAGHRVKVEAIVGFRSVLPHLVEANASGQMLGAAQDLVAAKIDVIRLANGMPLNPTGQLECAGTDAITKWISTCGGDFGIKMMAAAASSQHDIACDDSGPELFLQEIMIEVAATARSPAWPALVVVVNMCADNIPFCNLSKNAILAQDSCAALEACMGQALNSAFRQLKKKFPLAFDGFADWRLRRAKEFDAPFVAKHLANIVARSKNSAFSDRIKTMLADACKVEVEEEDGGKLKKRKVLQQSQELQTQASSSQFNPSQSNFDTQASWVEPVQSGAGKTEEEDAEFLQNRDLIQSQLTKLLLGGLDSAELRRKERLAVAEATQQLGGAFSTFQFYFLNFSSDRKFSSIFVFLFEFHVLALFFSTYSFQILICSTK